MSIVVTGATGHLGHLIVESLLERGIAPDQIIAAGRSLDKVQDLADRGVRIAAIDYTQPETLDAAFAGADTLMLVSGSEVGQRAAQHANAIAAAQRAGISRIVYTSVSGASTSPLILAPEHKATEEAIIASGIPFTFLRNGWYTENYSGTVDQAAQSGEIVASVGEGRVASASRRDYADAAAAVLAEQGHEGKTYELSGDVAWSHDELAAAAAAVLATPVTFRNVSSEDHVALLTSVGLDEGTAGFVAALDGNIREGLLAGTSGDLARLIGRPTTPLEEGLRATR